MAELASNLPYCSATLLLLRGETTPFRFQRPAFRVACFAIGDDPAVEQFQARVDLCQAIDGARQRLLGFVARPLCRRQLTLEVLELAHVILTA
jgi:hypothetical protein